MTDPSLRAQPHPDPSRPTTPTPIDDLHRRMHRGFLVAIAASALSAGLAGFAKAEPPPDGFTTGAAVALGLACVVLRRLSTSPMIGPRSEFGLGAAGLASGAMLALLGAFIAWDHDAARTGLAYAGAAFILCARPPIPSHLRVRRRRIDGR
jgi:drug/metabolite transporter (DMT)-like permease